MKAGIFGCGFIANTHARALRSCGVELCAVVSRDEEKAKAFAAQWNIPRWGTDLSCMTEAGVDCVHICTPPETHYAAAKLLLEHGKHIICEKPLCDDPAEAAELAALAAEKGLVCAVNFNVRFHDACQKARQLVQQPDFGPVLLVHGSYLQEFGALPAWKDWRYDSKMHAVTEIGSHWLDLAEYISGQRVVAVSAQFGCFWPERHVKDGTMYARALEGSTVCAVESEDAATVQLRFANGSIGAVTLSEVSQGRYNRLTLEVTGEGKNLWWDSENQNLLSYARKGGTVESNVFAFGTGFDDTFRKLMEQVYGDIGAGLPEKAEYATFADGAHSVALCEAVYRSAKADSKWMRVEG